MCSILDAGNNEDWPAEFALVLADRPEATGLEKARARGVTTKMVHFRKFRGRRAEFDQELLRQLQDERIDWVVLAGFMRILSSEFLDAFPGRVLNIHPSLLPNYPGLNTHTRVLEAGDAVHGCTVHLVSEQLDMGPVLGQAEVPVLAGDTAETLRIRVLEQEHILYPEVVRRAICGQLLSDAQAADSGGKAETR